MKTGKPIGKSDLELTKTVTGDEILIRQNQDISVSERLSSPGERFFLLTADFLGFLETGLNLY